MRKILLALLFVTNVQASPLNDEQAASIYALVYGVTHLPLPERPPEIHLTSNLKLQEMACPNKGCPTIHGYQIDNKVYLDEALDMSEVHSAAILAHELVHFLQHQKALHERCGKDLACLEDQSNGRAKTCREWVDREIYAYQIQNLILHKVGARLVQAPSMPTCNEPEVKVPEKPVAGIGLYTMRYL